MALDIIGLTLIIIFFIRGYMKGIIVAVFSMLAVLLGIILSLKFSAKVSGFLLERHIVSSSWAPLISYLILFLIVFLLVRLLSKALDSITKAATLGWLNGFVGGLTYAFMAALVWSSILWMCGEMQLLDEKTISGSKTYPYLSKLAPWVFDKIGHVWPMVKSIFADLKQVFDNLNKS
jgi:membrane protein required for colicin V production